MRWVETSTIVRFNEVDQWQIAWYGHYFAWFEIGRMKVLEMFSLLPGDFTTLGYVAPVVNARCDYKSPALTNDTIVIRTHLDNPQTTALTFRFEIVREADRRLLARGETTQVLTRLDGVMIYKLSGDLKDRIDAMIAHFWP
ncbi:MAG: acyl-CoA thioesterase [Syntrophobacteraceae bacterium]